MQNQYDPVDEVRRSLRRPLETCGVKLVAFLIPLWPRRMVVGFAWFLGHLAWLILGREKRFGLMNLDAVFGDTKTAAEKKKILTTSLSTFLLTLLDVFWFAKHSEQRISKYIECTPEFEVLFQKKAALIISAHFGK
jgi:Kdo2-lipid IVA lauroyltransferase/acyltransferase